ncbi:unnamed protein product [Auanema sp. JU1783]|nr:unnamed protein product [Auanema sp. JU1783]
MTSLTLHDLTDVLKAEDEKYADALRIAGEAFKEVENLFNSPNYENRADWKKDESNDEGDVVYAHRHRKPKTVTITTTLDTTPSTAMRETWDNFEKLPEWNGNINFASTIAKPTENFDVITYGNNDVLIVSGRDFVSARVYRQISDGFLMASRSVVLPQYPEVDGKVRAELVLAGARFRHHPEDPTKTICDVIMQADLKGFLPKFLVNQVIGKIMLMDTVTNREHFAEMSKKQGEDAQ